MLLMESNGYTQSSTLFKKRIFNNELYPLKVAHRQHQIGVVNGRKLKAEQIIQ